MNRMISDKSFEKLLEELLDEYKHVKSENASLRKRLKEWNSDKEIQAANARAEAYRKCSLLNLSPIEAERVQAFRYAHYKSCKNGSKFIYELTGTGIGTVIKIKCPVCGTEEDMTDCTMW